MAIADLPYLHAAGDGGPRSRTQVIVIHTTGNTASDEGEAGYATHRADRTSAHFYSDGDSVIRALPLGDVAYGCYPRGNAISVQFEITGYDNTVTDAELRQVAPVIAEVCQIYGIPVTRLNPSQVSGGAKGICGHADITQAFGEGDHMDGGARFPWSALMSYVAAAAAPASQEEDMPFIETFPLPTKPGECATFTVGPQGAGSQLGPAWLSIGIDPKNGNANYRIALSDGLPNHWQVLEGANAVRLSAAHPLWQGVQLTGGQRVISVDCLDGTTYKGSLNLCVEYGR